MSRQLLALLLLPLRCQRLVCAPGATAAGSGGVSTGHSFQLPLGAVIPRGMGGGVRPQAGDPDIWCLGRATTTARVLGRRCSASVVGRRYHHIGRQSSPVLVAEGGGDSCEVLRSGLCPWRACSRGRFSKPRKGSEQLVLVG